MANPSSKVPEAPVAPAAPNKPTPSPAPAPIEPSETPGSQTGDEVSTWESALAHDLDDGPAPTPPEPPKPKPAAKPADKPDPKPADKPSPIGDKPPADKPPAKPPEGRKAKLDPDELLSVEGVEDAELPEHVVTALSTMEARDLRLQSAKLAKTLRSVAIEKKKLESELAAAKTPKNDPERETLQKEYESLKQRHDEVERELRHANYSKSNDYKQKFETPFKDALAEAFEVVKELTFEAEDGTTRAGTPDDFNKLLSMPRGEAIKYAKDRFGYGAEEVLACKRKLNEIQTNARRELERYKTEGEQRERERQTQTENERKEIDGAWRAANEAILTKFKDHFSEVQGDDEGNAKLKAGYAEVDKAHDPKLTVKERVGRQAAIRHQAAAFPREVWRRKRAEAEVARLSKIIAEYEQSTPTTGDKDGEPPADPNDESDAMAAIDRMAQARS